MHFSWVDRDMFMRYLGGGVGHLHQGFSSQEPADIGMVVDEPEESHALDIDDFDPNLELQNLQRIIQDTAEGITEEMVKKPGPDEDENNDSEDSDTSSQSEDSSDSDDFDSDELGPEDGEDEDDEDDGL
jgi:hypothetical protein